MSKKKLPPSRHARHSAYASAPIRDVLAVLLRQFRRPLQNIGFDLSFDLIGETAAQIAERTPPSEQSVALRDGLVRVVEESEAWFSAHHLTFTRSLQTDMGDMPGWETTAEFLDLANAKSNAELRVAGASALVLALGDVRYADHLLFLVAHPEVDDVNALMAQRILAFVSATEGQVNTEKWLPAVKAWIAAQQSA